VRQRRVLLIVAVTAVLIWIVVHTIKDLTLDYELKQDDGEVPVETLAAIFKEHEPEMWKQFETKMWKAGREKRKVTPSEVRPLFTAVYRKRFPYAPDEVIGRLLRVWIQQLDYLYTTDTALCYKFLFENLQFSMSRMRPDLVQKEIAIMLEVVKSDRSSGQEPLDEQSVEAPLKVVLGKLQQKYGENAHEWLIGPELGKSDNARACRIARDFYQQVLNLPEKDASRTIRFIKSQTQ